MIINKKKKKLQKKKKVFIFSTSFEERLNYKSDVERKFALAVEDLSGCSYERSLEERRDVKKTLREEHG